MTQDISKQITWRALGLALLACFAVMVVGQNPTIPPAVARGVVRIRVRVKIGETTTGLPRKRFFLIKGTLDQNKSFIHSLEQRPPTSRECYYRSLGASDALIRWLKEGDCDSVYCRQVDDKYLHGADAVPEFQQALAIGENEFGNREIARKWLVVNLPDNLRSRFFKRQQGDLQALLKQAEQVSKAKVQSVMTDRNGTAYLTDLEPGAYVLSNILPSEVQNKSILWKCPIDVKESDIVTATETPFLVSNKQGKCLVVENPLPACDLKKN